MRTVGIHMKRGKSDKTEWSDIESVVDDLIRSHAESAMDLELLFLDDTSDSMVELFRQTVYRWVDNSAELSRIEIVTSDYPGEPIEVRAIFIREFEPNTSYHAAVAESVDSASEMLGPMLGELKRRDSKEKTTIVKESGGENTNSYANEFVFTFGPRDISDLHKEVEVRVIHVMQGVALPGGGADEGRAAPTNVFHVRLPHSERG